MILFAVLCLWADVVSGIVKDTLTMDSTSRCDKMTSNPTLKEGDMYVIKPYEWHNHDPNLVNTQPPETCYIIVNFGSRVIHVKLQKWKCEINLPDIFLGIYDNCEGHTKHPLASITCNSNETKPVETTSTCATIYHHRGHVTQGYYFSVNVIAGHEIRTFPAGAMATVILSSMVLIMVLVKIVCMITGYENKLPKLNLNPEEEKKIMEEAAIHVRLQQAIAAGGEDSSSSLLVAPPGEYIATQNRSPRNASHTNISIENAPHLDYDFLNIHADRNSQPRLKRFPSYKASSIFRH